MSENVPTREALTSTSLLALGTSALSLGLGMIAFGGDLMRGVAVAAIGAVILVIKYKTGY